MQSISRVDQVLLLLRKQLAGRAQKKTPGSQGTVSTASSRESASDQSLAKLIAQRLDELRAAGLNDQRALSRVLVEQILLNEFGADLVNDAKFQQLVADVHATLEDDPSLDDLLSELAINK